MKNLPLGRAFCFAPALEAEGFPCPASVGNGESVRATGYITPQDVLAGRQQEIHAERDCKLEAARLQRQSRRQRAA